MKVPGALAWLFRLQNKIFLSFAVVVGVIMVCVILDVGLVVKTQSAETISDDLTHAIKNYEAIQRERLGNLALRLQNISESPRLKAALDLKKQDIPTVADVAEDIRTGFDLFQVCDKKGRLMAAFMGETKADIKVIEPSASPFDTFFGRAVDPENPLVATGAMTWSDRLFITITGPVIVKDKVVGGLRAGFEITTKLARELTDQTGSEVAFILGTGRIAASSLTPDMTATLETSLKAMGNLDTMAGKTTAFETTLAGTPFLVQVGPLNDPAGQRLGFQVQLRSKSRVLALVSRIRHEVLLLVGFGLIVSLGLAWLISRGITAPLTDLVRGTRMVDAGQLDVVIPVRTRDELGILAEAFNDMVKDLKEKERVKAVFGRYLPKAVADRVMADENSLQLGGEEREVAILFSDIRGFTSISEHIPPQNLVTMLNAYFTRMVDVLLAHEGTLDKYVGDAIMAVFGAPVADADAAVKAVHTALEMQAGLKELHAEFAAKGWPLFEIGIGINAGPVVAGNLGSIKQLSYTVIVEEVNLASRLCSKAAKGQVLISESVYRKVKWSFACTRLEPITVKNVSHPVQVYEVTGVAATAPAPAAGGVA